MQEYSGRDGGGGLRAGKSGLPEKKWALKPFLETVLSDLNSTRMLLYWDVMTSGFSEPQNLPCSLESAVSPLRTSTKSYLHTCRAGQLQACLLQEVSPDHPYLGRLPVLRVLLSSVTHFTESNNSKRVPSQPHWILSSSPCKLQVLPRSTPPPVCPWPSSPPPPASPAS